LGSGATVALDNLASVAINSALIPGANGTIDLGSSTYRFRTLYTGVTGIIAYGTTYKDTISFTEPAANRTITFGDPGGADSVVYLAAAQALTNKTIVAGSNTISGITAAMQVGTAGTAGMVLTNQGATSAPTWTTPTFATLAQTSYIEAGTNDITLSTTTQTSAPGTLTIPDLAGATHRIMTVATTGLAAGDIFYYNGTQIVRLAKGAGSYFLKMNAGATAPEWAVS
jgi:hypothetical protein